MRHRQTCFAKTGSLVEKSLRACAESKAEVRMM
jgi:hypothetical protein